MEKKVSKINIEDISKDENSVEIKLQKPRKKSKKEEKKEIDVEDNSENFELKESLSSFLENDRKSVSHEIFPKNKKYYYLKKGLFYGFISLSFVFLVFVYFNSKITTGEKLINRVSNHVILPAEKPLIYELSIKNVEILKNPSFLGTLPGDYAFVFQGVQKIIIYRYSEDKIVHAINLFEENALPNNPDLPQDNSKTFLEAENTATSSLK